MVTSLEVMTAKFKSHGYSRSNNHYSYSAGVRAMFFFFFPSGVVSVTELSGNIPISYPGAPVVDGSLKTAGFVSVLLRQRQVDKSQLDVMTPTIND